MLLGEIFRVAFGSLRANKLRSALTMLGIVIGVAAVIAMVALGNGAATAVQDRISRLGTTVLQINPQRIQQGGIGTSAQAKLSMPDVKALIERAPNVVGVNQQQDRPLQVVWGNKNTNVQVTGTAPNFLEVRSFAMAEGTMFTGAENIGRARVAVLGSDVLPLLDIPNPEAIIGEAIRIASRRFTVIGVMARMGTTGFGDADEQILIPFEQKALANDRIVGEMRGQRLDGHGAVELEVAREVDDAHAAAANLIPQLVLAGERGGEATVVVCRELNRWRSHGCRISRSRRLRSPWQGGRCAWLSPVMNV
jgi:putative ABC transport system permease protein